MRFFLRIIIGLYLFFAIESCKFEKPIFPNGLESVKTGWEKNDTKLFINSNCLYCHSDIDIHKDRHSFSWKSELFQEAIKIENREWCINCHAPLSKQKEIYYRKLRNDTSLTSVDYQLLSEGINCVSCHVRDGKILGTKNSKEGYHEVINSNIDKSEFCANCHQFNFPIFNRDSIEYSKVPMQNTYKEWKSTEQQESCQFCHYSKHELKGPYDTKWFLEQFYDFEVELEKDILTISFRLAKHRGHNLPSGDLFRSLVLEVSQDEKFKSIHISKTWSRKYAKLNRSEHNSYFRHLETDTTLPNSKKKVHLVFDRPPFSSFYVRLIYYYHDKKLGGDTLVKNSSLLIYQKKVY